MRRSIRVGLTLAMVAMPLVACGALLGIERLPIDDTDASAEASAEHDAGDAGDAGCGSSRTSCG
jgi:predicted small lipoprotein YifL